MPAIPDQLYANSDIAWDVILTDPQNGTVYLDADSFEPIYILSARNDTPAKFTIRDSETGVTVTASATVFTVTLAKVYTNTLTPDDYDWELFADDGSVNHFITRGVIDVLPDVINDAAVDRRSHTKKVLDALEARIEGRATKQLLQSVTVDTPDGSHSIEELSPEQTILWYNRYQRQYEREKDQERRKRGLKSSRTILTRFA